MKHSAVPFPWSVLFMHYERDCVYCWLFSPIVPIFSSQCWSNQDLKDNYRFSEKCESPTSSELSRIQRVAQGYITLWWTDALIVYSCRVLGLDLKQLSMKSCIEFHSIDCRWKYGSWTSIRVVLSSNRNFLFSPYMNVPVLAENYSKTIYDIMRWCQYEYIKRMFLFRTKWTLRNVCTCSNIRLENRSLGDGERKQR